MREITREEFDAITRETIADMNRPDNLGSAFGFRRAFLEHAKLRGFTQDQVDAAWVQNETQWRLRQPESI